MFNSFFQEEPGPGFVLRPNLQMRQVQIEGCGAFDAFTNADGLRETQAVLNVPKTGKRVLVLGDSFTYGICVQQSETFVVQAQKHFSGVRFINAGVPSWGTRQEFAWLKKFSPAVKPDALVLAWYPNDQGDNVVRLDYKDGFLLEEPTLFRGHVSLVYELYKSMHQAPKDRNSKKAEKITIQLFKELADWCQEKNLPFFVLRLPSRPATRWRLAHERQEMDRHLKIGSIPQISVLRELNAAPQNPYWPEHHFNRLGHKIVGEKLADYLKKNWKP